MRTGLTGALVQSWGQLVSLVVLSGLETMLDNFARQSISRVDKGLGCRKLTGEHLYLVWREIRNPDP